MNETPRESSAENFLLYDGDCPVCRRYVLWTAVRKTRPDIALLDARRTPDLVAQLRRRGVEVNDTMVLRLDGREYIGADAMRKLAAVAAGDRPPRWMPAGAMRRLYPLLVRGRKLLLRILGRPLIG